MTGMQGRHEEGKMSGAAASIGGSSVAAHHLCSPPCSPSTPSLRQLYASIQPVGGRSPTRTEPRYTLGDIRGTFLACAPFLCHAHVKRFLAGLISHLPTSVGVSRCCFYSHTLCISCSQSFSSSHAIGRGETSNRAGLPQTARCDPSTRATAMGRWRMEPHTPTP